MPCPIRIGANGVYTGGSAHPNDRCPHEPVNVHRARTDRQDEAEDQAPAPRRHRRRARDRPRCERRGLGRDPFPGTGEPARGQAGRERVGDPLGVKETYSFCGNDVS